MSSIFGTHVSPAALAIVVLERTFEEASTGSRLFVIRKVRTVDDYYYWNCSSEHGTGWSVGHPKQSFSPSETAREVDRLIREGWATEFEVLELKIPEPAVTPRDLADILG